MCGIAGTSLCDEAALRGLQRAIGHRGPDGAGTWSDPAGGMGFAHARLAIIDLSPEADQPMASPDGRYLITYNGEIFNYRELRAELEAKGERLQTKSDTEVLLRLLMREGEAALPRLVGMFALALWDRESRELLLARDRFGIKPMVWASLPEGGIAFASEIAALRGHPGVDLALDRQALSEYLACLYVPAPRTIHRGICKLPPGHVLRWQQGETPRVSCWWKPRLRGERRLATDDAVDELLPALRRAVADAMVADVPVGCFLSGGIDSSVVAALMQEERRRLAAAPVESFTMTFAEKRYDEREAAAAVAAHVGTTHRELPAEAKPGALALLDRFGEPFGNPTGFLVEELSRLARGHVSVALVGDGGDEVFAGYPRYAGGLLAQKYRRVPSWLREGVIAPAAQLIPESSAGLHQLRRAREFLEGASLPDAEMYASWVEYFTPAERQEMLGLAAPPPRPVAERYRAAASDEPLDAMQETDLATFLPGNILYYGDAMSMASALELRLPLLDHRVVERVACIAAETRVAHGPKTLLKGVARRLLPAEIVDRPKRGFNPPLGLWLKGPLAPMVEERLTPQRMARAGIAWEPVRRLLAEHRSGRRDHALKVWSLVVLDAWRETAGIA